MRLSVEDHNKRVRDIIKMTKQGLTQVEMADALGISASALGRFIIKARSYDELPPKPKPKLDTHKDFMLGSMSGAIQKQSEQFKEWLLKETRGELTVAEVAMTTLLDAYYNDIEAKEKDNV